MTFVYKHNSWMEDYMSCYDGSCRSGNEELKKFCCGVVLDKFMKFEEETKKRKKKKIKLECQEQLARLSKPKRVFREHEPLKTPGAPLEKLLPRISRLSKPKFVTPKYKKPKEEPYPLPGTVKDWEAHQKWLENRAKPKKDYQKFYQKLYETGTCSEKISHEGMQRIFSLARPKKKLICHRLRPRSGYHRRPTFANERICKLSEPRMTFHRNCEVDEISDSLRISKSALTYEPSNRIKSLAIPKNKKSRDSKEQKCVHCFRSISCDDVLFKERRFDLKTA